MVLLRERAVPVRGRFHNTFDFSLSMGMGMVSTRRGLTLEDLYHQKLTVSIKVNPPPTVAAAVAADTRCLRRRPLIEV